MSLVGNLTRSVVSSLARGLVGSDGGGDIDFAIASASVGADGVTWTVTFNRDAYQGVSYSNLDWSATGTTTGAIGLTYASGDMSSPWTLTGDTPAVNGETITLDWAGLANGIEDIDGNDLGAVSGFTVTNNVPPSSYVNDDYTQINNNYAGTANDSVTP